jgi:hypothetical protein
MIVEVKRPQASPAGNPKTPETPRENASASQEDKLNSRRATNSRKEK